MNVAETALVRTRTNTSPEDGYKHRTDLDWFHLSSQTTAEKILLS